MNLLHGNQVPEAASLVLACTLTATMSFVAASVPELSKWVLAAALLGALCVLALRSPFAALLASVVYAVLQGLLRRLLPETGDSALGDPLLLVLPLLALFTVAVNLRKSPFGVLGKVILSIQMALTCSIFNPFGAGLTAGVAQFIVVALPLTWFWVTSRAVRVDAARLRTFLAVIVALGVAVTAYGRIQVSIGFPPWDSAWIQERGLNSLLLGDFVRPFSSFTAASDYATFVGLSLMAAAALLLSAQRMSLVLGLVLLLASTIFIHELIVQGSRGILLTSVVPVVVGVLIRIGLKLRFAIAISASALLLLPTLIGSSPETALADATSTNSAALARQAQGLSDPFGEDSTLPGHINRLVDGVTTGFESPIGHGVGVIGLTGSFSGGGLQGTETSYGDLGVSLGVLGTVLGLMFASILLWELGRQPKTRRDEAYWLLLFLAVIPLGPPLTAGNYASQITYYALLGCVWTLLNNQHPDRPKTEEHPQPGRLLRR